MSVTTFLSFATVQCNIIQGKSTLYFGLANICVRSGQKGRKNVYNCKLDKKDWLYHKQRRADGQTLSQLDGVFPPKKADIQL